MENVIGRGKNFAFVDVVNFDGLQNLRFCKVTDATFCHDRDGNGVLDSLDHFRVAHSGDSSGGSDVGRDAFKGHDGGGACGLGNFGLFGGGHVHNDAAFEHLGKILVEFVTVLVCHVNLLEKVNRLFSRRNLKHSLDLLNIQFFIILIRSV